MIKSILMISAFPPCSRTAGQDYTKRLIEDIVSRGYKLDLIYASYPEHHPKIPNSVNVLKVIHPMFKNCVKRLAQHPFFTRRFNMETLKFIKNVADRYDMLYFDFSQVHMYSLYIQHPCKVLMSHDVICQKYSRKYGKVNVSWVKRIEKKVLNSARYIITFSDKDSDLIQKTYGIGAISINFYLKNTNYRYDKEDRIEDKFCFYGAWNREENKEALEYFIGKILPLIKEKKQYLIIGGGLCNEMKKRVESLGCFEVIGFVDDPIAEIAKCQALIAPLHLGAGVKVKVVDALTSGTSVIGTNVAFEGIEDNKNNKLFYRAASPEEFADIITTWKRQGADVKQTATDEFLDRYNANHFADLLEGL